MGRRTADPDRLQRRDVGAARPLRLEARDDRAEELAVGPHRARRRELVRRQVEREGEVGHLEAEDALGRRRGERRQRVVRRQRVGGPGQRHRRARVGRIAPHRHRSAAVSPARLEAAEGDPPCHADAGGGAGGREIRVREQRRGIGQLGEPRAGGRARVARRGGAGDVEHHRAPSRIRDEGRVHDERLELRARGGGAVGDRCDLGRLGADGEHAQPLHLGGGVEVRPAGGREREDEDEGDERAVHGRS